MSFAVDSGLDIARQVGNALEDEAAQPLEAVQRAAPEGVDHFSELETSISEWSFGYGVAWALARMRDPLMGSAQAGRVAEQAVQDAWRAFTAQGWAALLAADRADRGPREEAERPAAVHPGASEPPEAPEDSQYGDFLGKVARARPRRPPPREE